MLRRLVAMSALSMTLVSCSNTAPLRMPTPSPDMMTPPCKLLPPSANADEDLSIDVQNAECVRQLRLKVYQLQDWVRNVTTE